MPRTLNLSLGKGTTEGAGIFAIDGFFAAFLGALPFMAKALLIGEFLGVSSSLV
jgi:hypothetical protein